MNFTIKHGHRRNGKATRIYYVWKDMLKRCFSPTHKDYPRYGARGITVCDEWRKFEGFLRDMGEAPAGLTLERVDNNQGYSKPNCRWATHAEQSRNTRRTKLITHNGKTMCMVDWARAVGMGAPTLRDRLKRNWPIEKALTTPIRVWGR